jgi:hypothetical protein
VPFNRTEGLEKARRAFLDALRATERPERQRREPRALVENPHRGCPAPAGSAATEDRAGSKGGQSPPKATATPLV